MSSPSARFERADTRKRLHLPEALLERVVRHARRCLPEECCGILVGSRPGPASVRVREALAAENACSARREREYRVSPEAILEAQRAARRAGLDIVGYYHSHPGGAAIPSELDRRDAWPDTSYVIVGMDGGDVREVRSWRLAPDDGVFVEEELSCRQETR